MYLTIIDLYQTSRSYQGSLRGLLTTRLSPTWFRTGCKNPCSVETCLLKIHNDLRHTVDHKQCVYLALMDLSAGFDTVDHRMPLTTLNTKFVFTNLALQWMQSYLTNRSQMVYVNGFASPTNRLKYGVPQGSVFGPIFSLCILPLLVCLFILIMQNFVCTQMAHKFPYPLMNK